MKLIIASNNKGKIKEFKALLEPFGYEVLSQSEAGVNIEVEETGTTFAEKQKPFLMQLKIVQCLLMTVDLWLTL